MGQTKRYTSKSQFRKQGTTVMSSAKRHQSHASVMTWWNSELAVTLWCGCSLILSERYVAFVTFPTNIDRMWSIVNVVNVKIGLVWLLLSDTNPPTLRMKPPIWLPQGVFCHIASLFTLMFCQVWAGFGLGCDPEHGCCCYCGLYLLKTMRGTKQYRTLDFRHTHSRTGADAHMTL